MKRSKLVIGIVVVLALLFIMLLGRMFETNMQGKYQVKQAFISGTMTARLNPGTYGQWLGKITTYKAVATVGFGEQRGEGSADIDTIKVIFSDGSKAGISGLVRIRLPDTQEGLIALKKEYSGGYDHFIRSGVVPVIQNAVKLSANLRTAQDAYTTLALFQQAIDDQLEHGIYLTTSSLQDFKTATGDIETRQITEILRDDAGIPKRKSNRIQEIGCEVTECVIGVPAFDPKVEEMIALRKDEAMKTELSKQEAIRAKQDAITSEQQGLANVAEEKYKKEVELVAATTKAREKFEVAEFAAKEAEQEKLKKIQVAKGIAEELRIADGLSKREEFQINANVKRDIGVAEHLSKWVGPKFVMLSGENGGGGGIENALMIKMMQEMVERDAK